MDVRRPAPWSWLLLCTGFVVIAFLGAAAYAWHRTSSIDGMAQELAGNADPSIRTLVDARTQLHVLGTFVTSGILDATQHKPFPHEAFRRSVHRIRDDVDAYQRLPSFPTEPERWRAVESELTEVESRLEQAVSMLDAGDVAGAVALRDGSLGSAFERADLGLGRLIDFDADQGAHLGDEITAQRQAALRTSLVLHGVALALAFLMIGVSVAASRRYVRTLRKARETEALIRSVVSHDLRNPLSAISLSARSLQRTLDADAPGRKQVEMIVRNVGRMDRLIGDLLAAAKLQEGNPLAIEPAAQDVAAVVRDVIEVFAAPAAGKGVILRSALDDVVPPAWCDAGRIGQVLSNLVGNALKFTPRGGSVIVEARDEGTGEVRLSVRDTGEGIPEEALPHVFERFWQQEGHAARGTGLGLYIAKGIVDAHHGRIWVTSRVGEGSEFAFTVPAADEASMRRDSSAGVEPPSRTSSSPASRAASSSPRT
jgi:signal transduction histidine kinase